MAPARGFRLLELLLVVVAVFAEAADRSEICAQSNCSRNRVRTLNLLQKRFDQTNVTNIHDTSERRILPSADDGLAMLDSPSGTISRLARLPFDLLQVLRKREFNWYAVGRGALAVVLVIAFVVIVVFISRSEQKTKLEDELLALEEKRLELEGEIAAKRKAAEESRRSAAAEQDEGKESVEEKPLPTTEELLHEAKLKAKAQELVVRKTLEEVAAKLDPMIAKVDRAKDIVVDGATKAGEHVVESIKKDCNDVVHKVMETLDIDETQKRYVMDLLFPTPAEQDETSESGRSYLFAESPVNLAILVAGLMAPVQLQGIASWNKLVLLLTSPILCLLAFAIAHDFKQPCASGALWVWVIGMATILGCVVIIRGMFVYIASSAMAFLAKEEKDSLLDNVAASSTGPMNAFRKLLSGRSRGFFRALHAKDALCNGCTYRLLNTLSILEFLWGGVGVGLSMWNIVDDERFCMAPVVLTVAHVFAFFYVFLFFFNLVALGFKLATILVGTDSVALEILRTAKKFDDTYCPEAFPVVSILVRAFFLRDAEDTEAVEFMAVQRQLHELKEKRKSMEEQQAKVDKEIEQGESLAKQLADRQKRREAMSYDEEKFVEEHARKLEEAINKAAPLLDYTDAAIAYGRGAAEEAKNTDWSAVAERTRAQASAFAEDASTVMKQKTEEVARIGSEYASRASASAQELFDSEQVQNAVQSASAAAESARQSASAAAQTAKQSAQDAIGRKST